MTKFLTIKKAPRCSSGDSFASVESSSEETLSTRINSIINENKYLSSFEIAPESRRRDLHPHLLVDKKGIPLHELRRQRPPGQYNFKQLFKSNQQIPEELIETLK